MLRTILNNPHLFTNAKNGLIASKYLNKARRKRRYPIPSIEKHVEISKQRTNKSYRDIHEWIDDPQHKDERHDITKIPATFQMFKEKYGEQAAREYVQHLADDLSGKFNHLIEDVQVLIDKNLTYFGAKK